MTHAGKDTAPDRRGPQAPGCSRQFSNGKPARSRLLRVQLRNHEGQPGSCFRNAPARVVIVDDRPDIRELLSIRLGMVAGLDIVGLGANGSKAVDLARDLTPDLMTLDLLML